MYGLLDRWGRDGPEWYMYCMLMLSGFVAMTVAVYPLDPRVLCFSAAGEQELLLTDY